MSSLNGFANVLSTIRHNSQHADTTHRPPLDEWMWSRLTREHYVTLRGNEVLVHAITRMKLEHSLCKVKEARHEKDKYCMSPFM